MRRVYEIDVLKCPHSGGRRKIRNFLTDPRVIAKILVHLGLPTEPPAIADARPSPQPALPVA